MTQLHPTSPLQSRAWIAIAIAVAACVVAWLINPAHFYRSYLFAYIFWLNISLGAMALVMLHHLVGGAWGIVVRRLGEACFMTLPLMAILFIPIAVGFPHLYPWANESIWQGDAILQHRRPWFTGSAVAMRSLLYLATWAGLAFVLRRDSLALDSATNDVEAVRLERRLRATSRGGLVLLFITVSLAWTDWVMSLEIHWYSTAFGLSVIAGQGLAGCAMMILLLRIFSARERALAAMAEPDVVHDLGNLLLTTLVLWAYIAFAQFLVIWMGNTQEENIYYIHRSSSGWRWITILTMAFQFAVPFVALLMQDAKRRLYSLSLIAAGVLVMQLLHQLWIIAPSSPADLPGSAYWTDLLSPPLMGAAWIAVMWRSLTGAPLVPEGLRDSLEERQVRRVVGT